MQNVDVNQKVERFLSKSKKDSFMNIIYQSEYIYSIIYQLWYI